MSICKIDGFNRIYCFDSFFGEYEKLFGKNKSEYRRHLQKLYENLYILDNGKDAIRMPRFEKLVNVGNLYAIRHVTKINPRVIFAFQRSDGVVVLLTSFKEGSSSDYNAALSRAKSLMKELEE